ncbi:GT2 family glycosyltransferase [Dysgonomonas sp. PH5-45]|uniref:glycosyltransferase family 2 protein n=1 Tax=unclassified Dysgonomonas TaxID=2630389 RepID=UPI00247358D7|nr:MULTISPECIES: glycosyltransferase family 2 protein [unclassified Dysgonomonas]MDH6355024.1 GT2 family glycosyltransferase [Dysgonomonas sp. PH5-45]MDH6387924.1 GT2 family glycosyltransferase [Dysgonomonas sp. PH5-37]
MPKLSVIIVNYNVKYFLEQCLLSVFESKTDFRMEVFVVDNNSTDGSIEYLKPKFPNVTFIENKDNPGFAKANNQAIRLSKGQYILLLNPDTVVGEDVFANVCRFMDSHPLSGGVGVKMINGSGRFLPESKRGFPSPWNSFCKIFGLAKLFPNSSSFGKYHLRYLNENETHEVDVLAGAFMMMRKEALDKVGYLDEAFFMYGEDIDLSYRIVKGGYKNYYLPQRIIHYKGESTSKDDMKYVKVFYEAMHIFFKKHYPNYGRLYSFFISSGIALRASFAALRRIFGIKKEEASGKDTVVLLNRTEMTYGQIIERIDLHKGSRVQFHIYSPTSGMTVGTHFSQSVKKG